MRVLILGGTGMLGHQLWQAWQEKFVVYVSHRGGSVLLKKNPQSTLLNNRERLINYVSTENFETIVKALELASPSIVINCIGIIKQLPTAKDPIPSITVNALFPHQLAQLCQKHDAKLIQISTDCVFSGNKGNYTEQDNPDPTDLYGRTKLLGEVIAPNCLNIRTSIIGRELNSQNSLVEWFLSQKGKTVKGFDRAIYTGFTTQALAQIIEKIILEHPNLLGLWHISSDPITKYQLLSMMNQAFNLGITIEKDESFICDRSLNSQKFRNFAGYTPPTWEEMIAQLAASQ
ncbi:dTDP-4-dehydrorhamnose reductase family protein [Phormidium tenue]|jgi:dTDP-4-dehydrorhamnose reductase|uniref:dTDP-4-dehydrorhamnose reductase n=1 Tax=Phormidium tenue FACHB-1050 TaxID=2692857 RepID=A0ABR8CBA6_9CYAN|nr:SDR family oxidoreductase [Phormidium tenue]MBD2317400.1 SDR family oxidoreductase [Phormidium tenue FACHB-1050]